MKHVDTDMRGKVCMITGANTGMGYATAFALAQMGATVVLVCRNRERGEKALSEIRRRSGNDRTDLLLADLSSQTSIHHLVGEFKQQYKQLHVLVNNAGVLLGYRSQTVDGLETMFAVNHLAPFLLTNLLIDTLTASAPARVINVNSSKHRQSELRLEDLQSVNWFDPFATYGQSKLANLLFTYELARRLEGTGLTVNAASPPAVATQMTSPARRDLPWRLRLRFLFRKFSGEITPQQAAETVIYLATSPEVADVSEGYFSNKQLCRSSEASYDKALAQQLWHVSAQLTRLTPRHCSVRPSSKKLFLITEWAPV